jgi:hypothetical protein
MVIFIGSFVVICDSIINFNNKKLWKFNVLSIPPNTQSPIFHYVYSNFFHHLSEIKNSSLLKYAKIIFFDFPSKLVHLNYRHFLKQTWLDFYNYEFSS